MSRDGIRKPIQKRFENLVQMEPMSGCWLWVGTTWPNGYGSFTIIRGKQENTHRTSWKLYRDLIPEKMLVLHKCDTPSCVNPDHLFLGINKDNTQDMIKKGRSAKGEKNGRAKLSPEQVLKIREDDRLGTVIAPEYGVTPTMIYEIKHKRSWKHI